MTQLEAVIFDVDGTLADTEEIHRRAFNEAFKEFDLDWDWTPTLYEKLLTISGGFERISYYGADLAQNFHNPGEFSNFVRDMHRVKTKIYAQMLDEGEVPLRIGVERLLGEIREAELTLAIATSSTFSNLKTLLDRNLPNDWMSWFSAIATCDTVSEKKPSPAVYHSVLGLLNLESNRAVAIEDTVNGCLAATRAGIRTLVTTHFFTRHHHFPQASVVLDSLGDPDNGFRLISGEVGERQWAGVDLLHELATRQPPEHHPVEWETAQIATG